MVVGGRWPAMDAAMEVTVAGQQWGQPWCLVVADQQWTQQWNFMVAGQHWRQPWLLVVVGQRWVQPWSDWLLDSSGNSHGGGWWLASNGYSHGVDSYSPEMVTAVEAWCCNDGDSAGVRLVLVSRADMPGAKQ